MFNGIRTYLADPSHKKLFPLFLVIAIAIMLPLIVLVAQQSQTIRQRASESVSPPSPPYPSPTPGNSKGPYSFSLSNPQTKITCTKGDPNCKYTSVLTANNKIDKSLYNTTIYTTDSSKALTFVDFDGTTKTGRGIPSQRVVLPGEGGANTIITFTPPSNDIYYASLYIDGQICNENTTPPNSCNFYGASSLDIRMTTSGNTVTIEVINNSPAPEFTFDIEGRIVDSKGNPFVNFLGDVIVKNLTTNTSIKQTGHNWTLGSLKLGQYEVIASALSGYTVEHMVCFGCITSAGEKFHAGNKLTFGSGNNKLIGITFKYTPIIPTPTPFVCTACAADIDKSGKVDASDIKSLQLCFGKPGTGGCAVADINKDGFVNIGDITCASSQNGKTCAAPSACNACSADIDGNKIVNGVDLNTVIRCFGKPATGACAKSDTNKDGFVNINDITCVNANFGKQCK